MIISSIPENLNQIIKFKGKNKLIPFHISIILKGLIENSIINIYESGYLQRLSN